MFTRLFFLATLAVLITTQVFSSGIYVPKRIRRTVIKRPVQSTLTETLVFIVTLSSEGRALNIDLLYPDQLTQQNEFWIKVVQKEVKAHWRWEPKPKDMFLWTPDMNPELYITDENFRPLKPRR